MKKLLLAGVLPLLLPIVGRAADVPVHLTFAPEQATYADATEEYRRIWAEDGARMIQALQKASGMKFPASTINVVVFEGVSNSGGRGAPLQMRASYPTDVKKATLMHELGHRLDGPLRKWPADIDDDHRILVLYLSEAWEAAYGKEFAVQQIAYEKTLKGVYDYEGTWNWAMAMTREQRAAKLKAIQKMNGKSSFGFRTF